LRRAGIFTLGQLIEKSRGGLPPLPGLGAKSRAEVEELLEKMDSPVSEKTKE
jgi:DNA-directed RNA polymerase alpha subunit